jgi:dTDP-4-dehydrorhamnose 3,5-epimerase-like enzyme
MDIQSMLRYSPQEGDIIMHTDGSYHVVKAELRQGSMTVSAMHHINGTDPVEVQLNIPKVRANMIQGKQFLVRKTDESG